MFQDKRRFPHYRWQDAFPEKKSGDGAIIIIYIDHDLYQKQYGAI